MGLAIKITNYDHTVSECHLKLVTGVSWGSYISKCDLMYQCTFKQLSMQYVVIITLCCNEQALLNMLVTLYIILIFTLINNNSTIFIEENNVFNFI